MDDSKTNFFDQILVEIQERDDRDTSKLIDKAFDYYRTPGVKKTRRTSPLKSQTQNGEVEVDGIDFNEFSTLLDDLFQDQETKKPFHIPRGWITDLFKKFDKNSDNILDKKEFTWLWVKWIQVILKPKSALIIVDVQNDFITGSLSVSNCPAGHRGEEVVPVINKILDEVSFDLVVYSYDWHPVDHVSFYENVGKRKVIAKGGLPVNDDDNRLEDVQVFDEVTFEGPPRTDQKLWPKHCVQRTWGAELHPDLRVHKDSINVFKGTNPIVDSYSAFWDNNKLSETGLGKELKDRGITDVFVCGLAYDVCVGSTAEHANEYGFRTTLIDDASRGVDNKGISEMKNKLIDKLTVVVDSSRVRAMVQGQERRPEHGYHLSTFLK